MNRGHRLIVLILVFIFSFITYVYFLNAADNRLERDLITDNKEKQHQNEQLKEASKIENQQQIDIIENQRKITNELPSFNLSKPKPLYNVIENSITKAEITW
jgi:hypothetical protein